MRIAIATTFVRSGMICGLLFAAVGSTAVQAQEGSSKAAPGRTADGLLALYDFRETGGAVVKDRSGSGDAVDLKIDKMGAVRRANGVLEIRSPATIRSDKPATKITNAVRRSGEITIEAWIRPADVKQNGPARIVTLSQHATERNVTLGQEGDRFEVRFRTTKTSNNGIPQLQSDGNTVVVKLTHVVYTRRKDGRVEVTVDGKRSSSRKVDGNASNWNRGFKLALGNELNGDRSWRGSYFLVAIYGRALSDKEIRRNFNAGAGPGAKALQIARRKREQNSRMFETQVASLFARHCLECHDQSSAKGGLDLSQRYKALRGGESGKSFVPGKSADSLLWQMVESDDMPKNRQPMSDKEKAVLKRWIDGGAVWSLDEIEAIRFARRRSGENWLRRLTVVEYIETVKSTVGVDVERDARKILPPDFRADGFSNTAYNLNVDLGHVEAYAELARRIVERMDVPKFAKRFTDKQDLSEANLRRLIAGMGKRLLRGPLEGREVAALLRVSSAVQKEGGDFEEVASYLVEAMLQSPRFLYRMEIQRGDGKSKSVGEYELASRLSYIIWGAPPDDELIRAADAGELSDPRKAEAQVKRMLKDRRAVAKSSQFVSEWLNLNRLNNLRPNAGHFPNWNSQLADDMRAETLAYFHEVNWKQRRPLTDLFNAQIAFVTPRLAKHYGLKPQKSARKSNDGLLQYDVSKIPARGGLLTQGSVLTIGGDEASMVARGLFVLHDVLDGEVSDPPPCVDTTPVPTKPGMSQRSVALARIADNSCGGCHVKFEPLAFGLERFDGLGTYHEVDKHGNKLRDDGEILFPGDAKTVSYKSSAELMNLLARSERVKMTLTRKIVQFSLGRPLVKEDEPVLDEVNKEAAKNGGTYADVLTAILMSDLVRKTRTEKAPDE